MNNPINFSDPSGHCGLSPSLTTGDILSFFSFIGSCVQDITDAYNAYESGETRPAVLYAEATGLTDVLVSTANDVHQMNSNVSIVFSNAPLEERILPSIQVGTFAVGTAASIIGIPGGKAAAGSAEIPVTGARPRVKTENVVDKARSVDEFLTDATKFIGSDYQEVASGVYRSKDGLRQVRFTDSDLIPTNSVHLGPHGHFELLNKMGDFIKNIHIPLIDR